MRILVTLIFALLVLNSCKKQKPERIQFKPNVRLIDFNIRSAMTVDDIIELSESEYEKLASNKFNPKTDTIKYKNGEIYISFLKATNGCAEYEGDIDIKMDSIFLKLIHVNGLTCPEPACDRVQFRISNPENNRYKIQKK